MEVYIWYNKYYEMPTNLKATIKEAKKDKDKFVKQVTKELRIKMTEKKQQLKKLVSTMEGLITITRY
jgi:hypothetical protein